MSDEAIDQEVILEAAEQLEAIDQPALAPGAQLAMRRQELGWSVEQVATQLNLATRQIQAIEADNYAALPGMASVRGFIRAYAKLLKVEAEPLVRTLASRVTGPTGTLPLGPPLATTPFSDNRLSSMSQDALPSKQAIIVSLFIALIVAILAGQRLGWISVLPASIASKVDHGLAFLSGSARSASSSVAVNAGGTDAPSNSISAGMATEPIVASIESQTPPADPATPVVPGTDDAVINTRDMLVLKLREDSWVEIRRPDDSIWISRLVKAGAIEAFKVKESLVLTLGNASGVDVTLRGKPVALESDAKTNVARITLK